MSATRTYNGPDIITDNQATAQIAVPKTVSAKIGVQIVVRWDMERRSASESRSWKSRHRK